MFQGPEDKVRWRAEGSEGCVQSSDILVLLVVLFFVWQHHTAHRISVPRLGIEPMPLQWNHRVLLTLWVDCQGIPS